MNQAEVLYNDILQTLDKLLSNLGLMLEEIDVEYLTQADLYIEIFKALFPVLEPVLGGIAEDVPDVEVIQYLINVLAQDIIKMDLEHIKGELIVQGDAKSILNFLQLLLEISNMVLDKEGKPGKKNKKKRNRKQIKSSGNSIENDSASNRSVDNDRFHSVLGIKAEFDRSSMMGDSQVDPEQVNEESEGEVHHEEVQHHRNVERQHEDEATKGSKNDSQSVSRISEVSKSKESSEYDKRSKKKQASQQKGDDYYGEALKQSSGKKNVPKYLSRSNDNIKAHQVEPEDEEEYQYQYGRDDYQIEDEGTGQNYQEEESSHGQDYEGETPKEGEGDYEGESYDDNQYQGAHDREDIRAIDMKARSLMKKSHDEEDNYDEPESGDYQPGEEEEEEYYEGHEHGHGHHIDEDIQVMDEGDGYPEYGDEMDPRHMQDHMEEIGSEVEPQEESQVSENREEQYYVQEEQPKGKGRPKSAKTGGKKKKGSKAVAGREQRELMPPTAGMRKDKHNKSMPGKVSAKKKDSLGGKNKHLAHSKSEKNLNQGEDEEVSESAHEEHSEDHGMEPKDYQAGQEGEEYSQHEQIDEDVDGEEIGDQERMELQENLEEVPNGNIYKILSENVMRVKSNLRENKEIQDIGFDDVETIKMIAQQKNQYMQYLNDFMKEHQWREKKAGEMKELAEKNFTRKMKSERIKDENLKRDFDNQQRSLYFKMRDEKVNYLRKVHKTIFDLEKKRLINDKKEYMEFRKTKNSETRNMIDSIKNEYKNKLNLLREKNKNDKFERKVASEAQRAFFQDLEKKMKEEQMKEVERIKNKWRHEKEKFEMLMKDEGFLQDRVMQLYKRGAF